jgi:hypothetical protein
MWAAAATVATAELARGYFLERSTNLDAVPAFQTLATNIAGHWETTSYTDTNAVGALFYRVGVEE